MLDNAIIAIAAFAAGILNALAGGGSFLTFPALIYIGVPPIAANATSALAVFPGYLSSALGFREEIAHYPAKTLLRYCIITLIGGLLGSLLLLVTPSETFKAIVPWLLVLATALFAMGDQLTSWLQRHHTRQFPLQSGLFVVAIYGGYFNGGLGIMLLALFVAAGLTNLNTMNGLKNGLSFVLSAISVVIFAVAGIVYWPEAIVMMIAATAGGYLGARIARHVSRRAIKGLIVITGLVMSVTFFQ